ncbi:MAG: RpiB/LacA/LacB family sugar-phosphate isomerase [Chloroflexi bacterium]|jgi:ribose 5-phosphate isomerase B|nr:MAG: ribose-5-phosphate isomerase [Chloroflexi bacterium OLB13]MBC6956070.1 RpiB/LacA/LacB family sugar-phosphate isomerase [Chloroflexota bacterium]MBV6437185.1 Ribose-5-phosphate isomerase B [Anaerolineae bacterium]MDL1916743.1 RpiB/LacA/LacB family sugar-phosphate isomerase [Anaerolineae bacterium CFX4]OQY82086.1 MAG: ribose-5-phosphate isomerase [Anaerolineae bacterium UTCFX5]
MKLAIASDHAGYALKAHIVAYLAANGHHVIDLGVQTDAVRADYPDTAAAVAHAVLDGFAERGIVVCGSGVGACIAANKFNGIYAAIAHDTYSAAQGVEHDRMNVLCLGGRIVGPALAEQLVEAFVRAQPNPAPRYERRFEKLQAIERGHLNTQ